MSSFSRDSLRCRKLKYLKRLPRVSAVIAFHDEHLSVLTRTVHSIVNRAPRDLLHEVLLVNDASSDEKFTKSLRDYIKRHFDSRVKLIDLSTKLGPIKAQVAGARRATGEVLVRNFFCRHMLGNIRKLRNAFFENFGTTPLPLVTTGDKISDPPFCVT